MTTAPNSGKSERERVLPAKSTLSDKQLLRGDAAIIARKLLQSTNGPFSQSQVDVFDIIRLAEWIMEGEQEETSITLQPSFDTDNSVAVNPNIDRGPYPDLHIGKEGEK